MIGAASGLIFVLALVALLTVNGPIRDGCAKLGARVREHLYGPRPEAGPEDTEVASAEEDRFDYRIYGSGGQET